MTPEQIAHVVHSANRALQQEQDEVAIRISKPWNFTDEETRASAIAGVEAAQRGATPEDLHEQWVEWKRAHGWILGPVKDSGLKTHPSLIPYSQLPESEKIKDRLFSSIVVALS